MSSDQVVASYWNRHTAGWQRSDGNSYQSLAVSSYYPAMAKKVLYLTSCDQPHEGDEPVTDGVITVEFGYEGKTYETELCPEHVDEYHHWMSDYLDHGARLKSGGRVAVKASGAAKKVRQKAGNDVAAIREWAKEHGHKVSGRGRISADVKKAYEDAH